MGVLKIVTHSRTAADIAQRHGWLPGARYTNLRDIRHYPQLGLLDIDWADYSFPRHLAAARSTRPLLTVAQDVLTYRALPRIIDQAHELLLYAKQVLIVPKISGLTAEVNELIPQAFLIGYSVPSRYGATELDPRHVRRPTHLLGGRPDAQRRLARLMPVVSFDCNRFTLDAAFGDYFDGETFRPHPVGGYTRCLEDSVQNINALWSTYRRRRQ